MSWADAGDVLKWAVYLGVFGLITKRALKRPTVKVGQKDTAPETTKVVDDTDKQGEMKHG
jgi:hypothetical protein